MWSAAWQAATPRRSAWQQSSGDRSLADAAWQNKVTPNLKNRFMMGSLMAANIGGTSVVKIPAKTFYTKGYNFYPPQDNYPPMMGPPPGATWGTYHPVMSKGTIPEFEVEYSPLFYSVIYLVKVK